LIKIINSKKLLKLYKIGYFPMAVNALSEEIKFYKPNQRFIIPINSFHVPKKLLKEFKKKKFNYEINNNFLQVIESCAKTNQKRTETWINEIIKNSYINLFKEGVAKSIECYDKKELIAGLYGIHIGGCFFGESMFSKINNASKFCLLFLISILKKNNFKLLDSQFYNHHLLQFGAYEIDNKEYQLKLKKNINNKCFFPKKFDLENTIYILQSLIHKS